MGTPKKSERMDAFVRNLGGSDDPTHDPCYAGFFTCFNAQRYYEAHDVLEHLWLKKRDDNYGFFKGLIQLAGAFVHLQKQREFPDHPKHGRRLRPAVRLFRLARANLEPYGPRHMDLDVTETCALCDAMASRIVEDGFARNPWSPETAPHLVLRGR